MCAASCLRPRPRYWSFNGFLSGLVFTAACLAASPQVWAADEAPGVRPASESKAVGRTAEATRNATLPTVLSPRDVERYQRIFDLQRAGRYAEADREIAKLDDRMLVGVAMARRYLEASYRPSVGELSNWLSANKDVPDAGQLYQMAVKLRGKPKKNSPALATPIGADPGDFGGGEKLILPPSRVAPQKKPRSAAQEIAVEKHGTAITRAIRAGESAEAEKRLDRPEMRDHLSVGELDDWRRKVAWGYFLEGNDEAALRLASAATRSRSVVPLADWVAGLAAWRLNRFDNAAHHFSELGQNRNAINWDRSAGGFWAGRVAAKLRQPREAVKQWKIAAQEPRTFYGLLATRALGINQPYNWELPPLTEDEIRRLMQLPGARRAIALTEVGEYVLAEREVARLQAAARSDLGGALLGLSARLEIPAAQLRLGHVWREVKGPVYDAALYPVPPWEPESGFQVDRALMFAFMRQESGFNARALSPVGATGLMQLMPRTASLMADGNHGRGGEKRLLAPEYNLELGQRYLLHLRDNAIVRGNLVHLAAAYNAGPGNLQRWQAQVAHNNDPLVFVEAIPVAETRGFVERILLNYWVYRMRLGLPTASLDAMAAGNWPIYDGIPDPNRVVQNARN